MKGIFITSRDIDIIRMVYEYDKVGISQLTKRFFTSASACYKRVWTLKEAGYLSSTDLASSSVFGKGIQLIGLGPNGRLYLSAYYQIPRSEFRQIQNPQLVDHHLATCDFRLMLELSASGKEEVELEEWTTERQLRKNPPRVNGTAVIPDGSFTLRVGEKRQGFRVEIDRSSNTLARMKQKLAAYMKLDDTRPVLWVVPDERRVEHLLEWSQQVGEVTKLDPTVHWISQQGSDPLDKVWFIPGVKEAHAIIPT